MINLRCKDCKGTDVTEYTPGIFGDSRHRCNSCGKISATADFVVPTLFNRITASPEVLAPKLVYRSFIRRKEIRGNGLFLEIVPIKIKCYKSKVTPGVHYKNSAEAIAATVARLKEVKK